METYNFIALTKEGLELQVEINSDNEREAIETAKELAVDYGYEWITIIPLMYTFIIFKEDGSRITHTERARNVDDAWDRVYALYPEASYIELF